MSPGGREDKHAQQPRHEALPLQLTGGHVRVKKLELEEDRAAAPVWGRRNTTDLAEQGEYC